MKRERGRPEHPNAPQRAFDMAQLYRSGQTLKEIGAQFGVTRERVRQILKLYYGFDRSFGGLAVRVKTNVKHEAEALNQRTVRRYGITRAEYREHVKRYGASTVHGSPLQVFQNQRRSMIYTHGRSWELTFGEWWAVWCASGKWETRIQPRRRDSYCLARINGQGGFIKDNVHIITLAQAVSEYQRNRPRGASWKTTEVLEEMSQQYQGALKRLANR